MSSNPRKRIKLEYLECGSFFDDDYRAKHEKAKYSGKRVKVQHVGAPKNPFEASISKVTRSIGQGVAVNPITVPHLVHAFEAVSQVVLLLHLYLKPLHLSFARSCQPKICLLLKPCMCLVMNLRSHTPQEKGPLINFPHRFLKTFEEAMSHLVYLLVNHLSKMNFLR